MNLQLNKQCMQNLAESQGPQETALIKTINVISSENVRLQLQVDKLKAENDKLANV